MDTDNMHRKLGEAWPCDFYRAMHNNAKRGLQIACLSVCL